MLVALLATPVMAKTDLNDTQGNKVGVTVILTRDGSPVANGGDGGGQGIHLEDNVVTGAVYHGHWEQHFKTKITFGDGSTCEGYLVADRKVVNIKDGTRLVFTDYYEFTFDLNEDEVADAGFVGNAEVQIDGVNSLSLAYGLFHGTGDFEGQTLNIGHTWAPYIGVVNPWYGYWLKCEIYP